MPAALSASLSDQNPFVQTHAVQRMLDTTSLSSLSATGASASAGLSGPGSGYYHSPTEISQPSVPGPQDLGRATLMQMSELSRRAAVAAAAGVPLPTSFSALYGGGDGQRHHQSQQPQQPQGDHQKPSRADILGQIMEIHRESSSQGGWAGAVGASGSTQAQPLPSPPQQEQSSNWEARGRSLGRSGGFGEEREKHQERQRQRALSMQMDVDVEMDTRGRSEAQQRHRRRQSEGVRFLSEDRMRVGVAGGDDDRDKSPEEYVMPTRQNVVDQPPQQASSSAQQQQQPTGTTPFGPPPPGNSGNNPWATMFNFGAAPMNPTDEHEGLQVYTVGHLLPRNTGGDDAQGSWTFDASRLATGSMLGGLGIGGVGGTSPGSLNASEQNYSQGSEEMVQPTLSNALITAETSSTSSSGSSSALPGDASSQKLRVRRSTFVPGWAVPPRVLLVDDDAVSRQLSSKFLKVFGCTTDVAVDGVAAVNKMNLEKYDLVLMVSLISFFPDRRFLSFGIFG
jgi:CheY-like chemotaxis protein